jgi:trehalose 6-phosphate synthase
VIVVSHRGPFRFRRADDGTYPATRGAGGVVSALGPLLIGGERRSTWIAATLSPDDAPGASAHPDDLGVDLRLLELDRHQHRLHYDVVSNGVLWFLHHGLYDAIRRPAFDRRFRDAWEAYVAVNETFADAVVESGGEGETVLVQDYQLALVGAMARSRRPDLRIVHFTHTPFAGPDTMRMLPDDIGEQLCGALANAPAGFHTQRWARSYRASVAALLGPGGPEPVAFAASLGPDVDALEEVARGDACKAAAEWLDDAVDDRLVVLRTDRIEPSKNIVRGFLAFDRLLEARPGLRGRVVFVALLYPSRQTLPEYLAYANEVEQAVARVNDRWGTASWTPVLLDERDDFPRSVAGLRRYDVLFVNPIRDGLNLVAKEGPVLNRRDGVVCLSREAGAHEELASAVLTMNPFDVEQMAVALDDALGMPLDERAQRAESAGRLAAARSPERWLHDLLGHA